MNSLLVDNEMVDAFANTHLPWRLDVSRQSALFHSTRTFGDFWAVSSALGGMVGQRGQREIRRTEGEFLGVLLVHSGREVFTQGGAKAVVAAGSALIWDGVRPAECYSEGRLDKSTFFLPRDLGRQVLPRLDAVVGKPLVANATLKLLGSWIRTAMEADYLDQVAGETVGRTATDLLTAAVGSSADLVLDQRAILLMEIRSFIDRSFGNPELTIEDIAAATSVSIRHLHSLFERSGESCRQYLVRKRLSVAHQLLLERKDLPISSIAARCGYATPSSFSRAFRAAYGHTPTEARLSLS